MAPDIVYDSETVSLSITPRKVRRSRCMCLLFLFSIATFVGLAPIMVYRSLGVPLPDKLKAYRNVQPWMISPQPNPPAPDSDGADAQAPRSVQWQSPETATKAQTIVIPKAHLHPVHP